MTRAGLRRLDQRLRRLESRPVDPDKLAAAVDRYVEQGVLPKNSRLARATVRYAQRVDDYLRIQDEIAHEALKGESA